jgi:hypothetical protein
VLRGEDDVKARDEAPVAAPGVVLAHLCSFDGDRVAPVSERDSRVRPDLDGLAEDDEARDG